MMSLDLMSPNRHQTGHATTQTHAPAPFFLVSTGSEFQNEYWFDEVGGPK